MGKQTMIRCLEDLADYLSAHEPTEASIAHRLYKDTDCGASFGTCMALGKPRRQVWVARVRSTILGPALIGLRRKSRRGEGVSPTKEVREYLNLEEKGGRLILMDFEHDCEAVQYLSVGFGLSRVTVVDELTTVLTFEVQARDARPGVYVSSIVEGTDAEVQPEELAFPFTGGQFDAAVRRVEDAASEIWNDTHGCDECARRQGLDLDLGHPWPVDPECGGNGTII